MIKMALTSEYTAEQRKAMCQELKARRKREELTQRDLAEHLNDNPGNIARVESGNHSVGLEVVMMLAHGLGADLAIVDEWQLPWLKLTQAEMKALRVEARLRAMEFPEGATPALLSALDKLSAKEGE